MSAKDINHKYYLLVDNNLNLIERLTESEIEEKYNLKNVGYQIKQVVELRINGYLVIEDDERQNKDEKFKMFYENKKYKYYISNLATIYKINKKTNNRSLIKGYKKDGRGRYFTLDYKEVNVVKIVLDKFMGTLPKHYKILYKDNNSSNCSLRNIIVIDWNTYKRNSKNKRIQHQMTSSKDSLIKSGFINIYNKNNYQYFISKKGILKRLNTNNAQVKELKGRKTKKGIQVHLDSFSILKAELVAEAFCDELPDEYFIEYKNKNMENCSFNNLIIKDINEIVNSYPVDFNKLYPELKSNYTYFYDDNKYIYYVSKEAIIYRITKRTGYRRIFYGYVKRGDLYVKVSKKVIRLAKIVAETYIENLPEKYKIIFIDGNKYNCSVDNISVRNTNEKKKKDTTHINIGDLYPGLLEKGKLIFEDDSYNYYLTKDAEVFKINLKSGHMVQLKGSIKKHGIIVKIHQKEYRLAKLMVETYFEDLPRAYWIKFIDKNIHNCKLDNLYIVSQKNNNINKEKIQMTKEELLASKKINNGEYVKFFENRYWEYYVADNGTSYRKVKSSNKVHMIKPYIKKDKFLCIKVDGKEKLISHIVADAYYQTDGKYNIGFKDNDFTNCSIHNFVFYRKNKEIDFSKKNMLINSL